MHPFLDDLAELLPEGNVLIEVLILNFRKCRKNLADQALLDPLDLHIFLEDFPGNVQRQIGRIDDPFDETEVVRDQLFAFVADEHAANIQLKTLLTIVHEHVERLLGRQIEQSLEFAGSFGGKVNRAERRVVIVGNVLVELGIFIFCNIALGTGPDGFHRVQGLLFSLFDGAGAFDFFAINPFGGFTSGNVHDNRILDVVGVLLDDRADLPLVQICLELLLEVQGDLGAALISRLHSSTV